MSAENPPVPAAQPANIQPRPQNPALAIAPRDMDPDERMAWYMMQSSCCDARSLAQAIVKIRFGQTMGLDPYTSVTGLYVNQKSGKLCPSANLLAALIRKSKVYDYKVIEKTNTRCVLRFYRLCAGQWEVMPPDEVADIKDYQHLVKNGGPWKDYPKNMLFARAITNGQKTHAPDVTGGAALYTPDELPGGMEVDGETLEVRAAPVVAVIDSLPAFDPEQQQAQADLLSALQAAGKDLGWLGKALSLRECCLEDLTPAQCRRAQQLLTNLKQEG